MFTFHVVALPHTRTHKDYCACAYTQKVLNFCKMMHNLGHAVLHYGAEGSNVVCSQHVQIISSEEQEHFFGGHDWKKRTFPIEWNVRKAYWKLVNRRAVENIKVLKHEKDFVCLVGGICQKPIATQVGNDVITVEPFVGYTGVFAKFRVFESYTHQSAVYGMLSHDPEGSLYDAVIPNYYDLDDFPLTEVKQDYLLYIGRMIQRKGLRIALDVAEATGRKLILAGQGVKRQGDDFIETEEGGRIPLSDKVVYYGYADVAARAKLMGEAHAVLVPTIYMEPFGGVAVEAQLCGTPVITTDHAAFSETVKHGVTGWRCHTLEQFVWAANNTHLLRSPQNIRRVAAENYSLEKVGLMYQEYFGMLYNLWEEGWPKLDIERKDMNWLIKA